MAKKKLDIEIKDYLNKNWSQITKDIASMVEIPSCKKDGEFNKIYPTGTGACKAMEQALKISKRMGFKTKNHKNMIGIADIEGEKDTQIGFIAHCDVVPPGPGWHFNPYELNIVNGYMIGRGVIDDKGPLVILLHAINFWNKKLKKLPYSVRFLFGTDEETYSTDIKQYKKDFKEPEIIITPDADFPVPYGEKGLMRFSVSQKIEKGIIKEIKSGVTDNAVSGRTTAIVDAKGKWLDKNTSRLAHAITVERQENGDLKIITKGRSAHAAEPYLGIDSIAVFCQFMLEKNITNKKETEFIKFLNKIAGKPKGEEVGINWSDEHFQDLTIVPTQLTYKNGKISQAFDIRFPNCTNAEKIKKQICKHIPKGAKFESIKAYPPFIINPKSCLIQALSDAYVSATGEKTKLFTMGGATYARNFYCGTSFGPLRSWIAKPAWVGTLHGPDEGISEEEMKTSFNIYVHTIKNLMELNISDNLIREILMID